MEDKKVNIIAVSSVIILAIFIIIARVSLKKSRAFFLMCGADVAVILAVFAFVLIRQRYNRRRRLVESQLRSEGRELRLEYSFLRKVAGVPTKFAYKELEEATDNFRSWIGQGASGSIFKGILNDGTSVAVKRMGGQARGEKEFKSEVAAIACVQHVNLVRILGYCSVHSGPRFIVYEFIPNGSLDCWIFRKRGANKQRSGCLSWDLRYRVAIDVAKALSYIHHDCKSTILHLDVKPENILLDENYRALLSDFGLAKLVGKEESQVVTTIRGTRGYLAPEWILMNGVTEKCDVYSYGMVLLEMVGGRRNVCFIEKGNGQTSKKKWQFFPKVVTDKLKEGELMDIVDHRLVDGGGIDETQLRRLVYVALWCIQERPRLRPSMSLVVDMLEGRVPVDEPPETQMLILDLMLDGDEDLADDDGLKLRLAAMAVPQQEPCSHATAMATTSTYWTNSYLTGRS